MGFEYNPKSGYIWTATRVSSTVIPGVLRRPEFWLILLFHLSVGQLYRNGLIADASKVRSILSIDWQDIKVVTAMTTFFQVLK